MENSIEVIEIETAWLSNPAVIGSVKTSSVVAQLPKDLNGAASIVVGNQMMIFGGLRANQASNPDIFIFNIDNNNVSTLSSVFASMTFGQKTYLVSKGTYLVLISYIVTDRDTDTMARFNMSKYVKGLFLPY
jgi:hypothetical protein